MVSSNSSPVHLRRFLLPKVRIIRRLPEPGNEERGKNILFLFVAMRCRAPPASLG